MCLADSSGLQKCCQSTSGSSRASPWRLTIPRNIVRLTGIDSPFAILRQMRGKIAVLDLDDQTSMTFYHHVEKMHEVPSRYHKQFTGAYTDAAGLTTDRTGPHNHMKLPLDA
jgi:hypothetical protein